MTQYRMETFCIVKYCNFENFKISFRMRESFLVQTQSHKMLSLRSWLIPRTWMQSALDLSDRWRI